MDPLRISAPEHHSARGGTLRVRREALNGDFLTTISYRPRDCAYSVQLRIFDAPTPSTSDPVLAQRFVKELKSAEAWVKERPFLVDADLATALRGLTQLARRHLRLDPRCYYVTGPEPLHSDPPNGRHSPRPHDNRDQPA